MIQDTKDDLNLNSVDKAKAVEDKTREILELLQLESPTEPMIQLKNAMKIHKYIVENSSYSTEYSAEKEKILHRIENGEDIDYDTEELYSILIKKQGVCSTEAIMFRYLLRQNGMRGDVVKLNSKNSVEKHAATLVEIGEKIYYFDTTLERDMLKEESEDQKKFGYYAARTRY